MGWGPVKLVRAEKHLNSRGISSLGKGERLNPENHLAGSMGASKKDVAA